MQTTVLYMIAVASLAPTLATSIFNPAFDQLRSDLGANDTQISLCVSLYILLVTSALGEFGFGLTELDYRDGSP